MIDIMGNSQQDGPFTLDPPQKPCVYVRACMCMHACVHVRVCMSACATIHTRKALNYKHNLRLIFFFLESQSGWKFVK